MSAAGAMGSNGIVHPPPLLDKDDSLWQRVEDLSVQELVSQLSVKAFVVSVFPRTSRRDVERLHTEPAEPATHELRCELRPIVRTKMLRRTVLGEEFGQDLEHVVGSDLTTDLDRQALPRVLVDHRQHLQGTTVERPRAHEVVGPDVILVQRLQTDA